MPDGQPDLTTRRQKERERLITLHGKSPRDDKDFPFTGVLLSDAIKHCVDKFDLIRPFDEQNLKPANYKLTIGNQFSIGGQIHELSDRPGADELKIDPFQVAVIKTRETINMPSFLIARWNIRVQLAYQGLLWVGGPQVDAGYVGHLFCPIYNLSDKEVILHYGDPIAVIDFIRTSTYHEGESKLYEPVPPERILFEDYAPADLNSALYAVATTRVGRVEEGLEATERNVKGRLASFQEIEEKRFAVIQGRIDNFILIVFTVLAVLFAAVTIFVTRADQASVWNPAVFLMGLTAVFISAAAWMKVGTEGKTFGRVVQSLIVVFLLAAIIFFIRDIQPQQRQINGLRQEVEELKRKIKNPSSSPTASPAQSENGPSETSGQTTSQPPQGKKQ